MGGLAKICKIYGSMKVTGADGKVAVWIWDYVNDKPRLKSEMTQEQILASEKIRWNNAAQKHFTNKQSK